MDPHATAGAHIHSKGGLAAPRRSRRAGPERSVRPCFCSARMPDTSSAPPFEAEAARAYGHVRAASSAPVAGPGAARPVDRVDHTVAHSPCGRLVGCQRTRSAARTTIEPIVANPAPRSTDLPFGRSPVQDHIYIDELRLLESHPLAGCPPAAVVRPLPVTTACSHASPSAERAEQRTGSTDSEGRDGPRRLVQGGVTVRSHTTRSAKEARDGEFDAGMTGVVAGDGVGDLVGQGSDAVATAPRTDFGGAVELAERVQDGGQAGVETDHAGWAGAGARFEGGALAERSQATTA